MEIAAESGDPDRRTHLETCTGRSERRKGRKLFFRDFHSPIEPSKPAPRETMDGWIDRRRLQFDGFFPLLL